MLPERITLYSRPILEEWRSTPLQPRADRRPHRDPRGRPPFRLFRRRHARARGQRGVKALLKFSNVTLQARRPAAVREPRSGAWAGRGASDRRAQWQRQVEPDPPRRRAAPGASRAGSTARPSRLPTKRSPSTASCPCGVRLLFWARLSGTDDRLDPAMGLLGLASLADVPVRLLSSGQAEAGDACARRRVGRAVVAARRAAQRPRCRGRGPVRGGAWTSTARQAARSSPHRIRRCPANGAESSSARGQWLDWRADHARRAPRIGRRRVAADRLLPAGRDTGPLRGRSGRAPARPDRRRRPVDRGADRRAPADRAADRARPRRRNPRSARASWRWPRRRSRSPRLPRTG